MVADYIRKKKRNEDSVNIDLQKIPLKHGISETCRTHKEKFQNDTLIVRNWLYEAVSFIKNNAEDKYELMLADKLCRMMNEGKVQLDDVSKRYERAGLENASDNDVRLGFFDPYRNTVTGKQRNIIVVDIKQALKYGYPEIIMTLAHEGWHAVQEENGMIKVDIYNNISYVSGLIEIEQGAYNMGIKIYNKYARKNGLRTYKLLTREEVAEKLNAK